MQQPTRSGRGRPKRMGIEETEVLWTSMIGRSQGETEIPLDSYPAFPPTYTSPPSPSLCGTHAVGGLNPSSWLAWELNCISEGG